MLRSGSNWSCCGARCTAASGSLGDRLFLVQLYRWFPSILKVITIVRFKTLVRWHCAAKVSLKLEQLFGDNKHSGADREGRRATQPASRADESKRRNLAQRYTVLGKIADCSPNAPRFLGTRRIWTELTRAVDYEQFREPLACAIDATFYRPYRRPTDRGRFIVGKARRAD